MSALLTSKRPSRIRKTPAEISAVELKLWLNNRCDIALVDVREPHEFAGGHIADATLIPLGQVAARAGEIDPNAITVVYCKGGVRSAKAIVALKEAGFAGILVNLKDGITGWSQAIGSDLVKAA